MKVPYFTSFHFVVCVTVMVLALSAWTLYAEGREVMLAHNITSSPSLYMNGDEIRVKLKPGQVRPSQSIQEQISYRF